MPSLFPSLLDFIAHAASLQYSHLRRTVAEYGREHGVQFRSGEDVKVTKVHPDPERPSVTLANGEVVSADVVIGADGYILPGWVTRRELMEATSQEDVPTPTGVAVYKCVCYDLCSGGWRRGGLTTSV